MYWTRVLPIVALLCALVGCSSTAGPERPRGLELLVVAVDGGGALAADSAAARAATDALATVLQDAGHRVYGPEAIRSVRFGAGMDETDVLTALAGVSNPPLDGVVMARVLATKRAAGWRDAARVRVALRAVNANSGRALGAAESESATAVSLPSDCDLRCRGRELASAAAREASDAAGLLAARLDGATPRVARRERDAQRAAPRPSAVDAVRETEYAIVFEGFTPEERAGVEYTLERLPGAVELRAVYGSYARAEFWYASTLTASRLQRELYDAVDYEGLNAVLSFDRERFVLRKTRGGERRRAPADLDATW